MMTIIKMKVLVKLTTSKQNIIISKYHLELKVLLDTIEINQFLTVILQVLITDLLPHPSRHS